MKKQKRKKKKYERKQKKIEEATKILEKNSTKIIQILRKREMTLINCYWLIN